MVTPLILSTAKTKESVNETLRSMVLPLRIINLAGLQRYVISNGPPQISISHIRRTALTAGVPSVASIAPFDSFAEVLYVHPQED